MDRRAASRASADAVETPIGIAARRRVRSTSTASTSTDDALDAAVRRSTRDSWLAECDLTEEYFAQFGDRVPAALHAELASLRYHLQHQDA